MCGNPSAKPCRCTQVRIGTVCPAACPSPCGVVPAVRRESAGVVAWLRRLRPRPWPPLPPFPSPALRVCCVRVCAVFGLLVPLLRVGLSLLLCLTGPLLSCFCCPRCCCGPTLSRVSAGNVVVVDLVYSHDMDQRAVVVIGSDAVSGCDSWDEGDSGLREAMRRDREFVADFDDCIAGGFRALADVDRAIARFTGAPARYARRVLRCTGRGVSGVVARGVRV